MDKEQMEQEKRVLTQKINQQESKKETLKREQRNVQETLDNVSFEFQNGYKKLILLYQEEQRLGGKESLITQQNEEERAYYSRRDFERLQEDVTQLYQRKIQLGEEETERLYKKRSELVWD